MKLIYQLFIICFVVFSLFIIKDDLRSVFEDTVAYFDDDKIEKVIVKTTNSNVDQTLESSTRFPGALRVVGDLFTTDGSKTVLSKENILKLTNKNRMENGNLSPLIENSKLDFSAEKKMNDMFQKQYFEHISPSGIGVSDLATDVSYEYILIGENLALGNFKDDASLLLAWMESPGHRANILNQSYKEIGIAVGRGVFEGKTVWIAVQHFGLSKDVCPDVSDVLKTEIKLDQDEINKLEEEIALRREKIDKKIVYEGESLFEQVDQYNSLVFSYNKLTSELKQKIIDYNNQVKDFNTCLKEKTGAI